MAEPQVKADFEDHGPAKIEDPQLKLLLLSQRLTAIKRQREYDRNDYNREDEMAASPTVGGIDDDDEYEEYDGDDDNRKEPPLKYIQSIKHSHVMSEFVNDCDDDDDDDAISAETESNSMNMKHHSGDGEEDEERPTSAQQRTSANELRMAANRQSQCIMEPTPVSESFEYEGGEDTVEPFSWCRRQPLPKLPSKYDEREIARTAVGYSRLAQDYLDPDYLHDIRRKGTADHGDHDDAEVSKATNSGEENPTRKANSPTDSSSDEKKRISRRKSTLKAKSAKKLKSASQQKQKLTLSGKLLEISEDDDDATATGGLSRGNALFHRCVCAFPWRCAASLYDREGPAPDENPANMKKGFSGGKFSVKGDGFQLMGWLPSRDARMRRRGNGGNGSRTVSSARDSYRRKRCHDPFLYLRSHDDSAKYTFRHYHDWQAYVDEYRRHYTVSQAGTGMNTRVIPECSGRREAVAIVRTLSDSLRPRLQEFNIPDWEEFTDLSATPMRPLHLGASYRLGGVSDLGITWLSAVASHQHDGVVDYRYPTSRHIKLTTLRHPETMATQSKKRLASSSGDFTPGRTPRVEAISPHDAGIVIPAEPLHLVEDFRRLSRRDMYGAADMRPVGCRVLATWRPSESIRVKSANASSKNARVRTERKGTESKEISSEGAKHDSLHNKPSVSNGHLDSDGKARTGLLKLFKPPRGLDMFQTQYKSEEKSRKKKKSHTKVVDIGSTAVQSVARANDAEQTIMLNCSSSAINVDASNWTSLTSSDDKKRKPSGEKCRSPGNNRDKHLALKGRIHDDENSAAGKRSATKSGSLARKPITKNRVESDSPQREFLQVRGENKQERLKDSEPRDTSHQNRAHGSKEKDSGVFGKARIKLVAPYAQPLARDNVLVGSPYGTTPPFGNGELNTTVQSTS